MVQHANFTTTNHVQVCFRRGRVQVPCYSPVDQSMDAISEPRTSSIANVGRFHIRSVDLFVITMSESFRRSGSARGRQLSGGGLFYRYAAIFVPEVRQDHPQRSRKLGMGDKPRRRAKGSKRRCERHAHDLKVCNRKFARHRYYSPRTPKGLLIADRPKDNGFLLSTTVPRVGWTVVS